jgi:SAM-dependent methyltransferase
LEDAVTLGIEKSDYSKKLYKIKAINFKDIKQISIDYINSLSNASELHTRLNHGMAIIDDEQLLYKYIYSYSKMHKAKLYQTFEKTFTDKYLNKATINVIDYGCGQALATTLLIEYIKEQNLQIDIDNIILIEPSKLALSRGLLHIDVLKQKNYKVKALNKDLDCLEKSDLEFENDNLVLHLFSNILDVESFQLDRNFLEKISSNIQSNNYFICVSPNINAKRNGRLDRFYKYFDDNFNTDSISARDDDIGQYKRYEKIFKVKYTTQKEVTEVREEIKDYHIDIYTKLATYATILEPTLNTQRLKENIEDDPDYVIFKIRKVAEIITSKIFMNNGGEDESRVSQNDKIRYLSFEKKILSRKAQSHLHTIRTIGNIGTHTHIENPAKMLKDDAYFLSTALILLIEDLEENNII